MPDNAWMIAIAAGGLAVTIGTLVFLAGSLKGTFTARFDDIERRLGEIEAALKRLVYPFRSAPRRDED